MTVKKINVVAFILLNMITFGIYGVVKFCTISSNIERICDGDGKKQMHYIPACLLGLVTLGIYPLYWFHKQMNRMQDNAYRYGDLVRPQYSGESFLLWFLLGAFIAVGPIVALCQFISNYNAYAGIAGNVNPLPYTPYIPERMELINQARSMGNNKPATNNAPALEPGFSDSLTQPANKKLAPGQSMQPITQPVVQPQPPVSQPPMKGNTTEVKPDPKEETKPGVDGVGLTKAAPGVYRGGKTGTVTCVNGMYKGIDFPISHGEEMIIGTDPTSCNIIISQDNIYVSRKHCTIKYSSAGDTYTVVDHSTNGTFASNGQQLMKNAPKALKKGDLIHLGDANNTFKFG